MQVTLTNNHWKFRTEIYNRFWESVVFVGGHFRRTLYTSDLSH